MMVKQWISISCLSLVLMPGLSVQRAGAQAGTRVFSRPDAELTEPYTFISSVRELSDGRVIVVDGRDRLVNLVDMKSGETKTIGREGQGPGEYAMPSGVFAAKADTTLLFDMLNQKLLIISPQGKPAGEYSLRSEGQGLGSRVFSTPRYADASGRLYMVGPAMSMGPGGPAALDSVPVIRVDRAKKRVDTLVYIHPAKNNMQMSGGGGQRRVMFGMANPYSPRDEWAVAPDGRIAVVTPDPYRVRWIAPNGRATVGPVVPYEKEKVTDEDKERLENQRKNQLAVMITAQVNSRGTNQSSRVASPQDLPGFTDWPEFKPPFLQNAAEIAPNGDVWVLRTPTADDIPRYDVFDATGRLTGHVQLPKGSRLVGFGKKSLYLVVMDEVDLQYLRRYAL